MLKAQIAFISHGSKKMLNFFLIQALACTERATRCLSWIQKRQKHLILYCKHLKDNGKDENFKHTLLLFFALLII